MKKYLLIGLFIVIGTNLVVLGGVAYNRMVEATANITLTERELLLPYNNYPQKDNSGISLFINWRTSTGPVTTSEPYRYYSSKDVPITKNELYDLGFEEFDNNENSWLESRELYWALEFNGELYLAELKKANLDYQTAIALYEEQQSEVNNRDKVQSQARLQREKISNSRLFFLEASNNYESLANKFSMRQNVIIVKGLANPYYHSKQRRYSLLLKSLSIKNIMVPLEYRDVLSSLTRSDNNEITSPRYAVDVSWGNRLEPWITNTNKLEE